MDNVLQHFRKDEAPFIAQVESDIETAAGEYRPILTNFLDPRQVYIIETLVNQADGVKMLTFGGVASAERKRALIAPDYFEPQPEDYELAALEINYPQKFAELDHSHILGTLANAGIERNLFGDIVSDGTRWQVIVAASMGAWVQTNIDKIGRIGVRFEPIDIDQLVTPTNDWEALQLTIPSLRIDAVVAHVFNISRTRAKSLIEHDMVRLNFAVIARPDVEVDVRDILSVRGFGRLRIQAVLGTTKKDKLRVTADVTHK